jgi:S-adenosylmethionine:tRNA ribosyltransferase-isomerase
LGNNDLLVINDTKVIAARLFGNKETGGSVEMLLLGETQFPPVSEQAQWECLFKSASRIKEGTRICVNSHLTALVTAVKRQGIYEVILMHEGDLLSLLEGIGHIPLPPYIRRQDEPEDRRRYQTVYARQYGSAAAPTAGLHFSQEILDRLQDRGVEVAEVTLHVGLGTFRPIREKDIRKHHIHREVVEVSSAAAHTIKQAKRLGKRVVAVGTTTVRVLEFMTDDRGEVRSGRELCDLYIYPGYRFKMVDGMLTNFHQPRSSLLVLCSAFAGVQPLLRAYQEAIRRRYRFLSYGDAMFIV